MFLYIIYIIKNYKILKIYFWGRENEIFTVENRHQSWQWSVGHGWVMGQIGQHIWMGHTGHAWVSIRDE